VVALGGSGAEAARSGAELVRRYAEPHRRYHDLGHVRFVERTAAELAGPLGVAGAAAHVLAVAALAHDVVYAGRPGADEEASATWVRDRLTQAGADPAQRDEAARLVAATASHAAEPGDVLAAVLFDADLAILGSTEADYDAYAGKVREEYAGLPDDLWRAGRSAVLGELLGRAALYVTPPAARRWTVAARRDLAREIATLSAATG